MNEAANLKLTRAQAGRLGGLIGGRSRSKLKLAACRRNAKHGGWPKGRKRK